MSLLLLFNPANDTPPANTYAITDDSAGNTLVGHIGAGVYWIEKVAGAAATFDAAAVSSVGLTGDFVLRLKKLSGGTNLYGGGMNTDPTSADDFNSINRTWAWLPGSGFWRIYESGGAVGGFFADAIYAWMWRLGDQLSYGRGADLATAQAAPDRTVTDATTLYFDSAFYDIGNKLEALLYVPMALAGSLSVAFSTAGALTATGSLAGASTLTFSAAGVLGGTGALSGASSLTFSPTAAIQGIAAGSGTAALAFSTTGNVTGSGRLIGASPLVFSPAGALTGQGALAGASALVFAPVGILGGSGALSGASSVTFVPAGVLTASGALAGSSLLTFSATGTLDLPAAIGDLAGSTSLVFSAVGNVTGIAPLAGSSAFAFAAAAAISFTVVLPPPRVVVRIGEQGYSSGSTRSYRSSSSNRSYRSSAGGRSYSSRRGR